MFRVSAITSCLMVLAARASVQIHKTIIVTCRNQLLIMAHLNDVDMAAIGARGINTVDEPSKLDSMVVPLGSDSGRGATWHLPFGHRIEEK